MLTFIIPLKSTEYVANTIKFQKILASTLTHCNRVLNSKVLIVCDADKYSWPKANFTTLYVLPSGFTYGDYDKEYKLFAGCQYWLEKASRDDRVMFLDFDDLVHPLIEEASKPHLVDSSTVFINGWQQVFNRLYPIPDFNQRCGSSHIFSKSFIEISMPKYQQGSSWLFHRRHNYEKSFSKLLF